MLLSSSRLTTDKLEKRLAVVKADACIDEIRLHNNSLQSPLPAALFRPELKTLVLDSNYISYLPDKDIVGLTRLEKLSCSWNRLTSLPPSVCMLGNLTSLAVHHNSITQLPAELGRLTNLQDLNVGHNQLVEVPDLRPLRKLKTLSLERNPLPPSIAMSFWLPDEIRAVLNYGWSYCNCQRAVYAFLIIFEHRNPDVLPLEMTQRIAQMLWNARETFYT